MSLASLSSPVNAMDRACSTGKAVDQPCNVTSDDSPSDCYESMHAFKKIRTSTSGLRKSPNKWTKEENQKLTALVQSYGEKKWKRISAEMGGQKTGAQCAQHWKRVLSPEIRKGHWDENEEDLLLRLVVQYGSCWKKIAKKIPMRTDIQCRYQYLKAKQSREVPWDTKEDESLIKKVMEMANCSFFPLHDSSPSGSNTSSPGGSSNTSGCSASGSSPSGSDRSSSPPCSSPPIRSYNPTLASANGSSLSTTSISISSSPSNKENDGGLSSSYGSDSTDDDRMRFSGEFRKDAWDDKRDVHMSNSPETSSWRGPNGKEASLSGTCASCQRPVSSHVNRVVWLEVSEHMARLKLTSTLRTALECKTRCNELLGNKNPFASTGNYCNNNINEATKHYDMKHNGQGGDHHMGGMGGGYGVHNNNGGHGMERNGGGHFNDIKINNHNKMNGLSSSGGISLTNCNNNNITINITNSYTTANMNQNGINFAAITSSPTTPMKTERLPSHILSKTPIPPILSPAPPFPSFSQFSNPSFPSTHLPQPTSMKPALNHRGPGGVLNVQQATNALDSLAAVASILPREMLDYAQF